MTTLLAGAPPAKHSAPNNAKPPASPDKKAWIDEIHKPLAEYSANLPMADIVPDPQNRKDHDQAQLQELAGQISAEGLLQPILVRPLKNGTYMIIAGERRWLAHKLLKLRTIRAFIHKNETDLSHATKQLLENEGREDLNPIERARGYQRQLDLGMKQKDLVDLLNKSQPVVSNTLRLLELPAPVQKLFLDGNLTQAHGVELLRYAAWPKACALIANLAIKNETNAKRLQKLPFGDELETAGLAVELNYWYSLAQLPKNLKDHASVFEGENEYGDENFYCLDVDLGQKALAIEQARRVTAAKSSRSTGGDAQSAAGERTGMTAAQLKARNATIAENKQNRAESQLAHKAVLEHLKGTKDFEQGMIATVAMIAFEAHWKFHHSPRIKAVAEALGIELPARFSTVEPEKLKKLKPLDLLRLTAGCICDRCSEENIKYTNAIDNTVELVLGEKKTTAARTAAADQLAKIAAEKAAKRAGK